MKREILIAAALLAAVLVAGRWAGQRDKPTATPSPLASGVQEGIPASAEAEALIRRSAAQLRQLPPLQADLRFKVDLFGQRFFGPGRYIQQGQGSHMSLMELQFGSDEEAIHLRQLSDGQKLYIATTAMGESTLRYVDLEELQSLRKGSRKKPPESWLSIASLSGLLNQLAEHFQFETPRAGQLETIPVWTVSGCWRPAALARLMEGQVDVPPQGPIDWEQLPPYLPHRVELTLGNDKRFPGFPYRIVFQQYSGQGKRRTLRPVVVLELYQVKQVQEIPEDLFRVPVSSARADDVTDFYRRRILQFTR